MESSYLKGNMCWIYFLKQEKLAVKSCQSPMAQSIYLTREDELFEDPERYRRLVGKLNYLTVTRLDIAYSVIVVSQYISSPTVNHWAVVEQILCLLERSPGTWFYTIIMDIIDLSVSRMQIRQNLRKTEGLLRVTMCLLEGI